VAYYYVLNTGSSTTAGGTTKKSGPFSGLPATAVYGSISAAITYGAGSGDFICVSDAHSYTIETAIEYVGPVTGDFLHIATVEDGNCDTEAVAASVQESTDGAYYFDFKGRLAIHGCYFKCQRDFRLNLADTQATFYSSTLEVLSSDHWISSLVDGTFGSFHNCEIKGAAGSLSRAGNGAVLLFFGCTFTGILDLWTGPMGANGGCTIIMEGCEISSVSGYLVEDGGNTATSDDIINISYHGCRLNAGVDFWQETKENLSHRLTVTASSDDSDAAEYQFHQGGYGGQVDEQDSAGVHRDESTAYPGGEKVSLQCVTTADATKGAPFWFDFPVRYSEFSNAATDTVRVYLTSTTALYDSDVWFEMLHPDSTTKQLYEFVTTRHDNILDTNGTVLTTDSGSTWKDGASDLTGYNEYYVDIPSSSGADCVPIIRVYVAKASATIYFCTSVDLV